MSLPNDAINHCVQEIIGVTCVLLLQCVLWMCMWIQWPIVHILTIWGQWPQITPRRPLGWGHMCAHTPISFCPRPTKIHQSMWIQWSIVHILTIWGQLPKITHTRPLTPFSLGLHVCPEPNILFPGTMQKRSKYVGTVSNFARVNIFWHTTHTHTPLHTPTYGDHFKVPFFVMTGTFLIQ